MIPILKSVRLVNFKSHKDTTLNLSSRMDFYGKNARGKTSIGEGIRFALFPKKEDVDKIKIGEKEAQVFFEMGVKNADGKDVKLEVVSSINREGVHKRSVKFDGIPPQSPTKFLKDVITFGSFNPRDFVKKEGRLNRLLSLIDFKVDKKDFDGFPINMDDVSWDDHAVNVLCKIDNDLRKKKTLLYQKADMVKKHYLRFDKDVKAQKLFYTKTYSSDLKESIDEILKKSGSLDEVLKNANKELSDCKCKLEDTYSLIKVKRKNLLKAKEEVSDILKELEKKEKFIRDEDCDITGSNLIASNLSDKISLIEKKVKDIEDERELNLTNISQARSKQSLDHSLKMNDEYKKEWEESQKVHDNHYKFITDEFPKVRRKVLKPLIDKVPGLDISEGKITIDGKSIDELSESETVSLGLLLKSIHNKTGITLVDCAECMDKDRIKKTKWPANTVLFRVGDSPLGVRGWKSLEIL